MIIEDRFSSVISERTITFDGATSQVLSAGDGPSLVLLHGDGETPASWQWTMPTLARDYHVLAPSLPGHADTDTPDRSHSVAYMTGFMSDYLDALGVDRCVIVGSSLGGLLAVRLVLAHPSRFVGLILVGSSGLGREVHPALAMMSLPAMGEAGIAMARWPLGTRARALARLTQMFARYDRAPAAWLAEQRRLAAVPGFLEASLAANRAGVRPWGQVEIVLDDLERIALPTLVVWGANDLVVPLSHARRAVDHLPDGELVVVPQCGHLPHVERSQEFLAAVIPFLERVPSG
jgi:pimeloyl-ACP methyl ester carboxylesterase